MSLIQLSKKNKMLVMVIIAYLVALILMPGKAIESGKNSLYYIKEMLTIMPVIFVLTSLIETWIPRNIIINSLGEKSGVGGIALSFALGSLSAGPIYAAFPICKTLLSKGASVLNIVIILSSWAVIKVPMLINEVKFLGFNYMLVRWILTTISIFTIAYITSRLINKESIPLHRECSSSELVEFLDEYCVSCGRCVADCPMYFHMEEGKVRLKQAQINKNSIERIKEIAQKCPTKAIVVNKD